MKLFLGAGDGGPIDLEPRHLRTHGVVVGMTGSGKTGLCLVLLEELARQRIPVIAIDPKGDLGNLALVFPSLDAGGFAGWSDTPAETALRWKAGLARWDLGSEQLEELLHGEESEHFNYFMEEALES